MKSFCMAPAVKLVLGLVALEVCGCGAKTPGGAGSDAGAHPDGSPDLSTGTNDGSTDANNCTVAEDLISDFQIDNGLNAAAGLKGGWYTYADQSGYGTLYPPQGGGGVFDVPDAGTDPSFGFDSTVGNPGCSGPGSWHVLASGFTDWGAATGVDFVAKTVTDAGISAKGTYDASKYKGISFWAKAAPGTAVKFVQVSFLDPYTVIPSVLSADEACVYDVTMPTKNCSPYIVKFGYGYTGDDAAAVAADYPGYVDYKIDDTWRKFEILFADTKQDRGNVGQPSPGNMLATSQLTGMAIQVNTDHNTTPPTANAFEIWLDDITFMKK
jgi:hypothetical protein